MGHYSLTYSMNNFSSFQAPSPLKENGPSVITSGHHYTPSQQQPPLSVFPPPMTAGVGLNQPPDPFSALGQLGQDLR